MTTFRTAPLNLQTVAQNLRSNKVSLPSWFFDNLRDEPFGTGVWGFQEEETLSGLAYSMDPASATLTIFRRGDAVALYDEILASALPFRVEVRVGTDPTRGFIIDDEVPNEGDASLGGVPVWISPVC